MKFNRALILLTLLAIVCGTTSAYAQAQASPTVVAANTPLTVLADHDGADTEGYRLYVDGQKVGTDVPVATALADGVVTLPASPMARGVHSVQVEAFNVDGGVKSDSISVSAMGKPPSKPGLPRVKGATAVATIAPDGTTTIYMGKLSFADPGEASSSVAP